MSLITRPGTHCLILAIVAAIVLPVRALLKSDYANERRSIETKGRKDRTRELLAQWNSLKYTPASSGNLTQDVLGRINWAGLHITEVQKTKLKHRLGELFNYLQNPNFDEYYRLKTEGLDWKFELNNQLPKSLGPSAFFAEQRAASDPRELVRSFWDAMNKETPDKITSISLDHIAIATSDTNSAHSIVSGKVSKGLTTSQRALNPGFKYRFDEKLALSATNKQLYVHLSSAFSPNQTLQRTQLRFI